MATPQEKPGSTSETSPLEENDDYDEDYEEIVDTGHVCGCFWRLCFGRAQRNVDGSYRYLLQQQGEMRESWVVKKVKKVKEISEVLAGPRWKNFIRRFSNKRSRTQFQYDPRSYALNFDDGVNREVDGAHHNFSARFAAPLWINNGELGRDPAAC